MWPSASSQAATLLQRGLVLCMSACGHNSSSLHCSATNGPPCVFQLHNCRVLSRSALRLQALRPMHARAESLPIAVAYSLHAVTRAPSSTRLVRRRRRPPPLATAVAADAAAAARPAVSGPTSVAAVPALPAASGTHQLCKVQPFTVGRAWSPHPGAGHLGHLLASAAAYDYVGRAARCTHRVTLHLLPQHRCMELGISTRARPLTDVRHPHLHWLSTPGPRRACGCLRGTRCAPQLTAWLMRGTS
jgi:hypothetical protein